MSQHTGVPACPPQNRRCVYLIFRYVSGLSCPKMSSCYSIVCSCRCCVRGQPSYLWICRPITVLPWPIIHRSNFDPDTKQKQTIEKPLVEDVRLPHRWNATRAYGNVNICGNVRRLATLMGRSFPICLSPTAPAGAYRLCPSGAGVDRPHISLCNHYKLHQTRR